MEKNTTDRELKYSIYNKDNRDERERFVKNIFDKAVQKYDFMNSLMTLGLNKHWRKLLVKYSRLKPGENGLDICCGTGMLTIELAKTVGPTGTITGIDFSEKMLKIANKRVLKKRMKQQINFIQGNALNLPFKNNSFDCASNAWGLRNVADIRLAIQEMIRVVKRGSKILSLDMAQSELLLLNNIYWPCFKVLIPGISSIFSSYKKGYQYLYESAKLFLNQEQLAELFQEMGLINVNYHNLCGGVVAIVEGIKGNL